MDSLVERIESAVSAAIDTTVPAAAGSDPLVRPSDHADFQSNAPLALGKRVGSPPRELAQALVEILRGDGEAPIATVEVSGPGFLNLSLSDAAVWDQVSERLRSPRLGIGSPQAGVRTVIDYSAPNIAKEMHVGHLRTTIIGDALVRVLTFLGADVIRQNHLGDWGTQFGMLIQYLDERPDAVWHHDQLGTGGSPVSALNALYKEARTRFDGDPEFAERARARVVALQAGDPETLECWREIVAESELAFQAIYARLGVLLEPGDSAGESMHNEHLPGIVVELTDAGLAVESDGALVIASEQDQGRDGIPATLMVRKSDGGYGYDTTDLATIRYRLRDLEADRLLYVVDARQSLHFRVIFETARRIGWLTDAVSVDHVAFGTVLGAGGRPLQTRAGDTPRLGDLLDSAVAKARELIAGRDDDLSADAVDQLADQVGIGAVKYADLATSRTRDYAFDIDRMVSLNGNTGTYLQYAHARICSILRKSGQDVERPAAGDESLSIDAALPSDRSALTAAVFPVDRTLPLAPAERALALALDAFGGVVAEVGVTLEPHRLCAQLYDIAKAYSEFYEACPVLSSDEPVRSNRLALCQLAEATLRLGLRLLGIAAPERM